jgi:hypothetical protein
MKVWLPISPEARAEKLQDLELFFEHCKHGMAAAEEDEALEELGFGTLQEATDFYQQLLALGSM